MLLWPLRTTNSCLLPRINQQHKINQLLRINLLQPRINQPLPRINQLLLRISQPLRRSGKRQKTKR